MGIKHLFTSAVTDSPDTTRVRPSNWNADHTIDGDVNFAGFDITDVGNMRRVLEANETLYVRTAPTLVTVSIASPAVVSWGSHGLAIGDQVCFHTDAKFQSCTITEANPGVVTAATHGFVANDAIEFHSTGTLPTNMSPQDTCYVLSTDLSAGTFKFATSPGGSAVNTSGSVQTGTHYVRRARHVKVGTCTISIAAVAVVTCASHGLVAGTPIVFSTTGALPQTIASGEQYVFNVSASSLNVNDFIPLITGSTNNTTGNTQSGTHTLWRLTGLPTGLIDGYPYYVISAGYGANSFQISLTSGGAAVNTTGTNSGVPIYAHTGNDSNDGSAATAAGAFLTPQGAVDYIYQNLDFAGWTVTVQLAHGVYGTWDTYNQDAGFTIPFSWTGSGALAIQGDSTATHETVLAIDDHRADLIGIGSIGIDGAFAIRYLTLSNPTFGCVRQDASNVSMGIVSCNYLDVPTGDQTLILQSGNRNDITGTHFIYANKSADFHGIAHLYSAGMGTLVVHSGNLFLLNPQTYDSAFVSAANGGRILVAANQAGAVTGYRALVDGADSRVWEQVSGGTDAIMGTGISFGEFGWFVGPSFEVATIGPTSSTFANLPLVATQGAIASITDSTTTTWGATITGGGANPVLGWYNGTNWKVIGI